MVGHQIDVLVSRQDDRCRFDKCPFQIDRIGRAATAPDFIRQVVGRDRDPVVRGVPNVELGPRQTQLPEPFVFYQLQEIRAALHQAVFLTAALRFGFTTAATSIRSTDFCSTGAFAGVLATFGRRFGT